MRIITLEDIQNAGIPFSQYLQWIDYPLRNRQDFVFPTKSRIDLGGSDYCNLMPCALPKDDMLSIKIINRNEQRRRSGLLNMDSQILLYSYHDCDLKAIIDGNYITAVRTAAVAVHTIDNMVSQYKTVSLVGLGNIMNAVGEMWFPKINDKIVVKLYNYKDQAKLFVERFEKYTNIEFMVCDSYSELMTDSDLIISAVSYIENDFCDQSVYKKGCTIIPIHLRGFMECDKTFDNIIVSDLERAKSFKYYDSMKKVTYTDDVLNGSAPARNNSDDRVIIYNLGLAITDLVYAEMIYKKLESTGNDYSLGTNKKSYI